MQKTPVQRLPLQPLFPTATVGNAGGKAAGCCLASESQEAAFTSTSQSCPPARGKAIFCVNQAVLWKDNGFDGLRVGMSLPQKLAGKHTGEGQCRGKGWQPSLPRADKGERAFFVPRTLEVWRPALGVAGKLLCPPPIHPSSFTGQEAGPKLLLLLDPLPALAGRELPCCPERHCRESHLGWCSQKPNCLSKKQFIPPGDTHSV